MGREAEESNPSDWQSVDANLDRPCSEERQGGS